MNTRNLDNDIASFELLASFQKYDRLLNKLNVSIISESMKAELGKTLAIVVENRFSEKSPSKYDVVKALLDKGADVSQLHPIYYKGCLHSAIEHAINATDKTKEKKIIDLLLPHRACLTVKYAEPIYENYTVSNASPINHAHFYKDNWDIVKYIAEKTQPPLTSDEEDKAEFGGALINAVLNKREDVVIALIKANAAKNWTHNKESALHVAVKNQDIPMLKILLEHKFDVNKICNDLVPLEFACSLKFWHMATEFFAFDPLFKFANETQGHSALYNAIANKQHFLTAKLIQAGAKIAEADKLNPKTSCLHQAVINNDRPMIDIIFNNSDPKLLLNAQPVLLEAIAQGNVKMVECLLEKKVSCVEKNDNGSSVLHHAIKNSNANTPDIIKLLLEAGANPEELNCENNNMFSYSKKLTKDSPLYKKSYNALLLYSNSSQVPAILKKDFLEDLTEEITLKKTSGFFKTLNDISSLPAGVEKIEKILQRKQGNHLTDNVFTDSVFIEIFNCFEQANKEINFQQSDIFKTLKDRVSRISRLPEIDEWYKEKWKIIKEIKEKCDKQELNLPSNEQPPSYLQATIRKTNVSLNYSISLMDQFLLNLHTMISFKEFTIIENNQCREIQPHPSLIEALLKKLKNKKENDEDSIRNTYFSIIEILNCTYQPNIFSPEPPETKQWRESILLTAKAAPMQMGQTNNQVTYYTPGFFNHSPILTTAISSQTTAASTQAACAGITLSPVYNPSNH